MQVGSKQMDARIHHYYYFTHHDYDNINILLSYRRPNPYPICFEYCGPQRLVFREVDDD